MKFILRGLGHRVEGQRVNNRRVEGQRVNNRRVYVKGLKVRGYTSNG